jgi:chemotaxis protein MotB
MADKKDEKKELQPIIIKKKKGHGHGHHGGAWKVAYADFVTAMMAFFLLMWLLNATTQVQRMGIANYFSPVTVTKVNISGRGGVQD